MKQVIDAPVGQRAFENIKCGQFAGLFDTQAALDEQFEQSPVPEAIDLVGPRITSKAGGLGAAIAVFHRCSARARILGISRSRSRTVAVMRARVRARAFSKPCPRRVCRVIGMVRGAKGAKGESGSVAQAQMSEKNVRNSISQEYAVPRTSSPAPGPRWTDSGASNSVRNIVADVARKNGGTVLYIGVLVCHVVPEVCKCDRFMPQRPVNTADAGLVGLQIENRDLTEALRYTGDLYQFRGGQPPAPAVAGRASLRRPREYAE